jgi:hypothetical protein
LHSWEAEPVALDPAAVRMSEPLPFRLRFTIALRESELGSEEASAES